MGDADVEAGECDELVGLEVFSTILMMKQGGLARSSRSNVASYTKAWDAIRTLFGGTMDSTRLGLGPGSFSFNTPGGRCERCEGTGTIVVEMHFMADIEVVCEVCDGKRFTDKVLSVRVNRASIHDVLQMTVEEALEFFSARRAICSKLAPLSEVGLSYLRLGQTTSTLSGGEAQRLMLASYVGKGRGKDGTVLFIFDEPTIGLHLKDVDVLLSAIRKVVDVGHTALVVEHNTDFIAQCDYVVDLGPEGGDGGGQLVVAGSPADVARCVESWTGRHLADLRST
jgi:excinuclease ABC subunit A